MATTATICRLKQVSQRLLKTKYKHLSPPERRYIKLLEHKSMLDRNLTQFWRFIKRDENGSASQDNDWDFYHYAEAELTKVISQIERLATKQGWSEADAAKIQNSHNQHNLSPGGSF